ncbi:MAG: metallophosphoesterase [Ferruginibacter sp.]
MKLFYLLATLFFLNSNAIAQNVFYTKPYLQLGHNPSATSLELLWHTTDTNAAWQVEYRNDRKGKWAAADAATFANVAVAGATAHRVYHATMTHLTSGGTFTYQIKKDKKVVFTADAQAPKSASQPFRFVTFGDIGAESKEQKALATRVMLSKPDLVTVTGDIVYEYGLISEYRKKFWPVYNADVADANGAPILRSVPWAAAVGNHDTDSRDLDKQPEALAYFAYWSQPLNGPNNKEGSATVPMLKGTEANKNAFYAAAGDAYPRMTNFSFNYGNAHYTVLDMNNYVDWADSLLKDWVKRDLANSVSSVWHFVMIHQPGFNSSVEHSEQQQMRILAPIFEAGKVDIVFAGHVHNYQRSFPLTFAPVKNGTLMMGGKDGKTLRGRVVPGLWTLDKHFDGKIITKPNGVVYIITGAGGKTLYNPEQEDKPNSWQKFTDKFISTVHSLTLTEVNGNTLSIKQLTAEGKELDSFTITK